MQSAEGSPKRPEQGRILLTRRALIAAGGATALGFLLHRQRFNLRDLFLTPTEAERFLKEFPTASAIPRVASLRKIRTGGSHHTLVHIRQIHRRPEEEMTPEIWQLVRAAQDDIEQILISLMDRPTIALRTVYDEGLDPLARSIEVLSQDIERALEGVDATHLLEGLLEEEPLHRRMLELEEAELESLKETKPILDTEEQYQKHIAALQRSIAARKADLDRLAKVREEIAQRKDKKREEDSQQRFRRSATEHLARTRGLQRLVAEDLIRNLRADHIVGKAVSGERVDAQTYEQSVHTDRELALLRIIAERGDITAVTVYGAAHNWEGEIAQWNTLHPDKTFSLIEVTPQTVADNSSWVEELARRGRE